jgi:NADH:ubiquinone reductase (H+-translocating)
LANTDGIWLDGRLVWLV